MTKLPEPALLIKPLIDRTLAILRRHNLLEDNTSTPDRGPGSPYDCGSRDAYYGRGPVSHPHKCPPGEPETRLTLPEEIAEYYLGFEEEPDRKDWS